MEQATDAHSVGGSAYNTDEVRKLICLSPLLGLSISTLDVANDLLSEACESS